MNDIQMKIFITVADAHSFSAAENEFHMSKQAMIKQIRNLEHEIDCELFTRSRHGVELTEEGTLFYTGVKKLLKEQDDLVFSILKKNGNDVLRIGNVQHQSLLDRVTNRFTTLYPDIRIQRVVHPNHSGEWRVSQRVQDVAEAFISDVPFQEQGDFTFQPLISYPYVVIMDPSHPLAEHDSLSLQELTDYDLTVMPMMLMDDYLQQIQNVFVSHTEHYHESMDVDHQVEAVYALLNTNRIMIGANPFIYEIPELKKIPLALPWKREYGIIYKEPMNYIVSRYVDLAIQMYAEKK